jgi:hypothetical protein
MASLPGRVIARNYTEDVIWSDPDGTFQGYEAMNEQGQEVLDRMPDFVVSAAGPVHVSRYLGPSQLHNLGVPKQRPAVSGVDVALVRDGRIAALPTLLTAQG